MMVHVNVRVAPNVQAYYLPWLREALDEGGGVEHVKRKLASLQELSECGDYQAVFNCTGARSGLLFSA